MRKTCLIRLLHANLWSLVVICILSQIPCSSHRVAGVQRDETGSIGLSVPAERIALDDYRTKIVGGSVENDEISRRYRTITERENDYSERDFNTKVITSSSPWPKANGDNSNSGRSAYAGVQFVNLLWTYSTNASVDSSPIIGADGTIFVGSNDTYLYALTSKGALKWRYKTGKELLQSAALSPDGSSIYVGSLDKKIYSLSSSTGVLQWSSTTQGGIYTSPAVAKDGTIYFGSLDSHLYAFSPLGVEKWKYLTGNPIYYSSPAVTKNNGKVYIGSDSLYVHAVDASTGTMIWRFLTAGYIQASPTINNDETVLYVCSFYYLYALNTTDGSRLWSFQARNYMGSAVTLGIDGSIYVGK